MVLTPLNNLLQDSLVDLDRMSAPATASGVKVGTHVGEGHGVARVTKVIEHVLDEDGALGSCAVCMESVLEFW